MKVRQGSLFLMRVLGVLVCAVFALSGLVTPARAATLCVAPGGAGGCFATIQAAITAAAPGDTIVVAPGVYNEINIVINKSITLIGDPGDANPGPGPNAPVVDGGGAPGDAFKLVHGVSNVTIQGFEIRNYTSNDTGIGNGVSAWVGSTTNISILDNYFHDLGWNATLVGNDKSADPTKWGDHSGWLVRGNILERWDAYGFELTNTSNSIIENNIITADTTYDSTISILITARRNVSNIIIRGNQIGGTSTQSYPPVYLYAYDFETPNVNLNNVLIEHNYITASSGSPYQVYLRDIGTGTVTNARVVNNSLLYLRALTAQTVDAEYNWWGNPNGPYDPADEVGETTEVPPCDGVGGLAMVNADGTTGLVRGNADYCPWNMLPLLVATSNPEDASVLLGGVSQIQVLYNKDVKSDGSAGSATNPANYLLLEDGANGEFNTINCLGGVAGDDVGIVINSVGYDAGTFTATLNVNNGVPLPAGTYRLLICGTTSVQDLGGSKLNFGIADTVVNFTVMAMGGAGGGGAAALPATGFAPGKVTVLPEQTTAYTAMGDLWLEIPALGVKANIVGVPARDGRWDVSWLWDQVGWLHGTAFPTWEGNSVLTAHVYRSDGQAGPFLDLRSLTYGDRVIVHAYGQRYIFEVRNSRLVSPGNTEYTFQHLEGYSYLTLVTCQGYEPSTGEYRWRRVVRAVLVKVENE